jgi:hypothetical protein
MTYEIYYKAETALQEYLKQYTDDSQDIRTLFDNLTFDEFTLIMQGRKGRKIKIGTDGDFNDAPLTWKYT